MAIIMAGRILREPEKKKYEEKRYHSHEFFMKICGQLEKQKWKTNVAYILGEFVAGLLS